MEDNISTFIAITGAASEVARGFLQITAGQLERAIELFYENPDLVGAGVTTTTTTTTATAVAAAASSSRSGHAAPRTNAGRQDASGVIHISSDDEDTDMQYNNDDDEEEDEDEDIYDDENDRAVALQAAALAQQEEDAAMAKRLQEELYQASGEGSGDVRAPIARTTETLVAPDPAWGGGGDLEAGFLDRMRSRRPAPRSSGPFAQRIWTDGSSSSRATGGGGGGGGGSSENGAHARRLEDLFRPPYDLMARLPWDEARDAGKVQKKWIMVNLQDMNDFNCQTLNRDIWKDQAVRDLVSENFIFLQYDKDYPDSEEYLTFYFPNRGHENPDNYPHVSIIDPRTGEQVKVWSGRPFPSAREFHAEVAEFLDRYSLAANSKNPVAKMTTRKTQVVDVDRMTEDEMLEMALKNSLAGPSGEGSGVATPSILDPDALTKAPETEGEVEEEESTTTAAVALADGAFAQISSTNPHVEPDNNPATTTRIQFRHPNGRIIRRFNLRDEVRTTYEWLKAEPIPGKEGLAFELKKMPQGEDLIERLDETIEQAGLKQGTVMIEFITEE